MSRFDEKAKERFEKIEARLDELEAKVEGEDEPVKEFNIEGGSVE